MLNTSFVTFLSAVLVCSLLKAAAAAEDTDPEVSAAEKYADAVAPPYYLMSIRAEVYILPVLPYENADLEPYIDRETVEAHYYGHHETYRRRMNVALNEWRELEPTNTLTTQPLVKIAQNLDKAPFELRNKLNVNVGGFVNHVLFWSTMGANPNGTERFPTDDLFDEIEKTFGSYFEFKVRFSTEAIDLVGSGYVWLARDNNLPGRPLVITMTRNQDCPLSMDLDPILGLDVWEHAYYLKHQFRRVEYITNWWMLVNWKAVERLDNFWRKVAATNFERDEL